MQYKKKVGKGQIKDGKKRRAACGIRPPKVASVKVAPERSVPTNYRIVCMVVNGLLNHSARTTTAGTTAGTHAPKSRAAHYGLFVCTWKRLCGRRDSASASATGPTGPAGTCGTFLCTISTRLILRAVSRLVWAAAWATGLWRWGRWVEDIPNLLDISHYVGVPVLHVRVVARLSSVLA